MKDERLDARSPSMIKLLVHKKDFKGEAEEFFEHTKD